MGVGSLFDTPREPRTPQINNSHRTPNASLNSGFGSTSRFARTPRSVVKRSAARTPGTPGRAQHDSEMYIISVVELRGATPEVCPVFASWVIVITFPPSLLLFIYHLKPCNYIYHFVPIPSQHCVCPLLGTFLIFVGWNCRVESSISWSDSITISRQSCLFKYLGLDWNVQSAWG